MGKDLPMDEPSLPATTTTAAGDALSVHRTTDGRTTRIALEGEVDLSTSRAVLDAVEVALSSGTDALQLDLGGVSFLDSSGLSTVVGAARKATARGTTVTTHVPLTSDARTLIDLAGVDDVLNVKA
jgi:anti-anti-sigma factor